MASADGNPYISRPRPLIKRSQSTSTATASSSRRRTLSSTFSSRYSSWSSSSQGSSSGSSSVMSNIIRILNTPLSELNDPHNPRIRSSKSDGSSLFSRFSRREEKRRADEYQSYRGAACRPPTSLRDTTMSLLSEYSTCRSSMMSSGTARLEKDDIIASTMRYCGSMRNYLDLIDELPVAVRDTMEVQRLRQQLEFTVELLEPVTDEDENEQILPILENALVLVKKLLSDVHYLLMQQMNWSVPDLQEEEQEEEDSPYESEPIYEHGIPKAHLATLFNEPDREGTKAERGGYLRKMRSSMALLGGSSRQGEPTQDSSYTTPEGSQEDFTSSDGHEPVRRVRFSLPESRTQESLTDLSESIEAVSESLTAINACPLFTEDAYTRPSSVCPINKPDDTVDITYGQDGIPVAMSSNAIIEQLIEEFGSSYCNSEPPAEDFSDIILTTFRFFWRPEEFLDYLENAYDDSYYIDRKKVIVLVAQTWVAAYWLPQDSQTRNLIRRMRCFLDKALTDNLAIRSITEKTLYRLGEYATDHRRSAIEHDVPRLDYEPMPFRFIDIPRDVPLMCGNYDLIRVMMFNNSKGCLQLSRQLTLKESKHYLQLTAREVIGYFISSEEDEETALAKEKMRKWRDFSCTLTRWASWNVLKRTTPLKRAKAFSFMMRLAKYLLGLRNFSSAHAIYNGALSIHLDHLRTTEAELPPKARANMSYITEFFDQNREISMQSSAEPTIPIMAIYAGKLSRLKGCKGMRTPSKVDESVELINISFFRAATRITYAMESNQHPYDFKAHAPMQHFINYTLGKVPGEDEIRKLYLKAKQEELTAEIPRSGLMQRLRTNSVMAIQNL